MSVELSVEEVADLRKFEELVLSWTARINLVSREQRTHLWDRHILDSVQLSRALVERCTWLDVGSGGGFPGIVLAVIAKHRSISVDFTLVDSDKRKCAFLTYASHSLSLNVHVRAERVEDLAMDSADKISARAFTSVGRIIALTGPHLRKDGELHLLCGENWKKEVELARKEYNFDLEATPSVTNPASSVLKISAIRHA
ncbi:16S rRNA m(7)G-527 methyltransferase [Poseidonocella pacifica]|uniref:Ribosomal RNA small subunit methyltransferase G n=1 Tax=Poseidonocella pacifica TaxID=871651 RepID=A0A1I0XWC0_9RHOB|nr:16S rRNA (guanine(527)-N(7))-methyltransferase RsmG [Poseidonocella pacifica]SFB04746.1 16S rRNA m(7)G-527 methyltransferase [Poseidonocella pacifica]